MLVACSLAVTLACVKQDAPVYFDETGGPVDADHQPCRFCKPDAAWHCVCLVLDPVEYELNESADKYYCWSGSIYDVEDACGDYCYDADFFEVTRVDFCSAPQSPNCEDWTPATSVTLDPETGETVVDRTFVAALVEDTGPLLGCDSARFEHLATGGFRVVDVTRGDLMSALGLRDGDTFVALNGYELDDDADVTLTFARLWLFEDETHYSLELRRNGRSIVLEYRLEGL